MRELELPLLSRNWETISWKKTPYQGVFICKVEEKQDPNSPNAPKYTIMALKMEPKAEIPLHRHNREFLWTETIILPNGGWFETKNDQQSKKIKTKKPFAIVIQAGEMFGLKNMDTAPLCFYSIMKPGFTGYQEIEEVKITKKS